MEEYKSYCLELLATELGEPMSYKDYLVRRFAVSEDPKYLSLLAAQSIIKSERTTRNLEKERRALAPFERRGGVSDLNMACCKQIRCVTLTTDIDEPHALIAAADKIIKSNMFDIRHYWYAVELTKAGLPHIHMLIGSHAKRFDASKIKSFWKKRYECVKPIDKTGDAYYKYLFKEINNPIVIDYCIKHGIAQTKSSEETVEEKADVQEEAIV